MRASTKDPSLTVAHRPPWLSVNAGGFGDVGKASEVFERNEIGPLKVRLLGINTKLGVEAIRLKQPAAS